MKDPGHPGDVTNMKKQMELIYRWGYYRSYDMPAGLGFYPPLFNINHVVLGQINAKLMSGDFSSTNLPMHLLMKSPAVVSDMFIGFVIMIIAWKYGSPGKAIVASGLYFLNPAVIYNNVTMGMIGDPIYTLFLILSIFFAMEKKLIMSYLFITLSFLTKPQGLFVAPLIFLSGWANRKREQVSEAVLVCLSVTLLVVTPFILKGTFDQLAYRMLHMVGLFSYTSNYADNLWWIFSSFDSKAIVSGVSRNDEVRWLGLTLGNIGSIMISAIYIPLIVIYLKNRHEKVILLKIASTILLTFFVISTEMHRNYIYAFIPMSIMTGVFDRRWWTFAVIASLTLLANWNVININHGLNSGVNVGLLLVILRVIFQKRGPAQLATH